MAKKSTKTAKQKQHPKSLENLKKGTPFTPGPNGTGAAAAKKGAAASHEAQRRKADINRILTQTLSMPIRTGALSAFDDLDSLSGVNGANLTVGESIAAKLALKALQGDIQAMKACMEMMGRINEKEAETAPAEAGKPYELPARLIGAAFVDLNRQIAPGHTYVLKGGRGSLKSTYASEKVIEYIEQHPDVHVVAVRKIQATIRDSVFEQLRWAIDMLGLTDQYKCTVSPMSIKKISTGQRIYFRGLDDPAKLKSIKPPFGYVGVLWVEEADQINGEAELRNVKQSCLRGGDGITILTYNPPKSRSAWVNQYAQAPSETTVVHESNYLQTPPEWLGPAFLEEAEHLKQTNPTAYAHEYGGEATGDGGNVFDNIEIREITDEEIARCDHIFQGNDWGYSPDPLAFVRLNYDRTREEILLIDEIVALKWSNHQAAEEIKRRGYDDTYITCDSAEKKSTADYRGDGLPARNAIKGPDSVRYGIKWLAARKIIIDPKRTPTAYKEFTKYEHERDRDGNPISGYPDKDNHTIDAVRYALECIWRQVYYKG